jgi:hypothetical protein
MLLHDPFAGAKAKLKRSEQHIIELVKEQASYNAAHPVSCSVMTIESGDSFIVADYGDPPGSEACTITADALCNMRAALDIATVQSCIARGQTDKKLLKSTFFAVGGSEADWKGNLPRRMAGADETVRSCVASFKPWKDEGNTLLYALTKLAANDKHVDLVPVAASDAMVTMNNLRIYRDDNEKVNIDLGPIATSDPNKIILMRVRSPGKVEIASPIDFKVGFGFGDVYALKQAKVIPTLNEMLVMCEQIVKTLELAAKS